MLEQTASHWGQNYFSQSFNRQEWQAHPLSIERQYQIQNRQMREVWFAQKYLEGRPANRAIGIGVGRAETEIALLQNGAVEHYDLFDVSPVGLDYAKSCAVERGFGEKVTTHCMPISEANLEEGAYDLVTFVASLHHMQPLDQTLTTVRRALKDGGLMWCANEYIGPDRFSYPDNHANIARAFFRQLPPTLKNPWHTELPLPTPEEVAAVDPTEAPCSSQIEATVRDIFGNLEITPLYGGFAFITFWGLNHDALYETPEGVELVRHVLGIDQALSDAGVLPNYFAHLVARKQAVASRAAVAGNGQHNPANRLKAMLASTMSTFGRRT